MQLSANVAQNPLSCNSTAHAHAVTVGQQEQGSSEEMRLREPGEGFKEMDESAVYDSACEDHLFSDAGNWSLAADDLTMFEKKVGNLNIKACKARSNISICDQNNM